MRVNHHSDLNEAAGARDAIIPQVTLGLGEREEAGADALRRAVASIYRHVRRGRRVAVRAGASEASLAAACEAVGLSTGRNTARGASVDVALVDKSGAIDEIADAVVGDHKGARLRVAIAGLGLIGEGLAHRLCETDAEYDLCAALVREPAKERPNLTVAQVTNDLSAFLASRPDVVIDALPDGPAGRALIRAALERGVSVISANKQAVAGTLQSLHALAGHSGATLLYSASVGGGAPFIETVERARENGAIVGIEAALNGTVNYILTALSSGEAFETAVIAAQKAGFAEPDPSADLSGGDARAKLSILSYAAFGEEIDLNRIEIEALDAAKAARFAAEGGCWKQLARLQRGADGAVSASVRFERRDDDALFAGALWEANALRIFKQDGSVIECRGKGAGRAPTVESLFADLADIRDARIAEQKAPRPALTLAAASA